VPAYGTYENLVVSSVGLKRFNLLGSSSSSRAGLSSLGCVSSFSRYLVLKLVISALTVGICRSVCRVVFATYHGAFTIDLRTLFNKEIHVHDIIVDKEITTTTTVTYNQIIGTIPNVPVLYVLPALLVVLNIIIVSKGPLRHATKEQTHTKKSPLIKIANNAVVVNLELQNNLIYQQNKEGTRWRNWLRHCATSQKVAGSIPNGVIHTICRPHYGPGVDSVPELSSGG